MKNALVLTCCSALLLAGCSEPDVVAAEVLDDAEVLDQILDEALEKSKLQSRGPEGEELFYVPNNSEPYSGWVKEMYSSGQVKALARVKDGKLHDGLWTGWHENGQKEREGTFKDGKKDGLWTRWNDNGQKESEITWKDGKLNGLWTEWHENGQKESEITFKDGKLNGLWTEWHENGQKKEEVTCKDGKEEGLWTAWHENGQKKWERIYKDGELVK